MDFSRRLQEQFPKAVMLWQSADEQPGEAVDGQHLTIFKVDEGGGKEAIFRGATGQ